MFDYGDAIIENEGVSPRPYLVAFVAADSGSLPATFGTVSISTDAAPSSTPSGMLVFALDVPYYTTTRSLLMRLSSPAPTTTRPLFICSFSFDSTKPITLLTTRFEALPIIDQATLTRTIAVLYIWIA